MAEYMSPEAWAAVNTEIRSIIFSASVSKTVYNSLGHFVSMQEAIIGSMYKFGNQKVIMKTSETTARFFNVDE